MIIDLNLSNTELYKGCTISTVAGRSTLVTPPDEAMNIIASNLEHMLAESEDRSTCTLTGQIAAWTYIYGCSDVPLCFPYVFRAVCKKFKRVYYDDGRGTQLIYAK